MIELLDSNRIHSFLYRLSFMRLSGFFYYIGKQGRDIMNVMPVINMTKPGQNIVILRKRAGLSVRDLQDAFGFGTPQAIYKWQQGLALPTIDNLVVLAALLGVTIDDIIVTDKEKLI